MNPNGGFVKEAFALGIFFAYPFTSVILKILNIRVGDSGSIFIMANIFSVLFDNMLVYSFLGFFLFSFPFMLGLLGSLTAGFKTINRIAAVVIIVAYVLVVSSFAFVLSPGAGVALFMFISIFAVAGMLLGYTLKRSLNHLRKATL